MKHAVRKFRSLAVALEELAPFVRNGQHLQTGKPFKSIGLRSREVLANWLLCVAVNHNLGMERLTFSSDPTGGDGIIFDTETEESWPTEHVLVPSLRKADDATTSDRILAAIEKKRAKGGAAYAAGKTLIVFLNAVGEPWFPTRVAKQLPEPLHFEAVWVVGLQTVNEGEYAYGVTRLDIRRGQAPTWLVTIAADFKSWRVEPVQ